MTPCYVVLPASQIGVGRGEAVSPWSFTGQGF